MAFFFFQNKSFLIRGGIYIYKGSLYIYIVVQSWFDMADARMIEKDFSRPLPPFDNAIIFQLLDIDCPNKNILRLFGITKRGNSVCCYVYDFFPYFYVNNYTQRDEQMFEELEKRNIIKTLEKCEKYNIYGYRKNGEYDNYLKITTFSTYQISIIKDKLSKQCQTFESNVDYPIRFMTDANIPGCCWIEIPPQSWEWQEKIKCDTTCQIQICLLNWKNLITHKWPNIAPLRILSFDIECAGRPGIFPKSDIDPIIQIGNVIITHKNDDNLDNDDDDNNNKDLSVIFTLNGCSPIQGATIISFTDEANMLQSWANFFVNVIDPDIITGYNINNFDLPYLLGRAKALNLDKTFPFLGRDKTKETIVKDILLFGRENKRINMEGRCLLDLLPVITRDYKLRSYSLNAVSFHFLKEQKEDVHYSNIRELQNGNDETRKRIAIYCLKDCLLPLKLLKKLSLLLNFVEMARVAGIPISYAINRGQQIKIFCQILRKATDRNLIIPDTKKKKKKKEGGGKGGDDDDDEDVIIEYEGATVIEPKRGYYDAPVITLDFASLYPSIMIAHNLCYTTLLPSPPPSHMVENIDYIVTPTNDYFIKSHIKKGLLPEILEELLSSRKKAKIDMKNSKEDWEKQSYNARQYALKILANSIYGFTGAQKLGVLPCVQISQSVTSFGRCMIALTKNKIEEVYKGSKVIYGDTDSVMVIFNNDDDDLTLSKAFDAGKQMARYVTENSFIHPIKLEFEKIYFPYLLVNKKRYAGLYYTNPKNYDKMDCKGIETVRRDNCRLVANVIDECLQKILIDRNPNAAIKFVQDTIANLLLDKIDIYQLVISKELKKKEYKGKQPHAELAKKLQRRAEKNAISGVVNNVPKLGERIQYVIIRGFRKDCRIYERAEDPIYVLENDISIDFDYYLNNQLSKPLIRIFEPIFGNKTESLILYGDHTRKKKITTGSCDMQLMKFVKIRQSCVECKLPIINKPGSSSNRGLCIKCLPKKEYIYKIQLEKLEKLTKDFDEIKETCIKCQKINTLEEKNYKDILCSNSDCPIYYKRKKVELDVQTQRGILTEKLSF